MSDISELPSIRVVAAVIENDGTYLVTQRQRHAVLPLLWEFPGGRAEEGEADEVALRREVEYSLSVSVEVGAMLGFVTHSYVNYSVDLYLYEARLQEVELNPSNVHAFRWISSEEFDNYAFTPADEASMSALLGIV